MSKDLRDMGFHNLVELKHGERVELRPGFSLTCYHFGVFQDSAIVVECDGTTLFNCNDAKFMGAPLQQILSRHGKIDFVLRSHSSANSRLCFEIIDDPVEQVDDESRYIRDFVAFARATGATYAIPFASNHCYLHKDVFHFNSRVTTPLMVKQYCERNKIDAPIVPIMLSGDSWSSDRGFEIAENDYFDRRQERLEDYRVAQAEKLDRSYALEAQAKIEWNQVETYFLKLFRAMPLVLRLLFRCQAFTYIATAGETRYIFEVDLWRGRVRQLESYTDQENPIQILTSVFVLQQCMESNLFSHLAISKRVKYRVTSSNKRYVQRLNLLFNLYEYELLPVRSLNKARCIEALCCRWREVVLYARIGIEFLTTRKFDMHRHLLPKHSCQDGIYSARSLS
jgi:UDP-MurNAc hydroxylase